MYNKKRKYLRYFDFLLVLTMSLLVVFGLFGIGIATRSPVDSSQGALDTLGIFNLHYVKLQLTWFFVGLVIMAVVIYIDYNYYKVLAPYIYWGAVALLLAVVFFGAVRGGARSWLAIGPFGLQPSEFTKIAIIIMLAKTLSKKKDEDEEEEEEYKGIRHIKELIPVVIQLIIPFVLIFMQPDLGTAMVLIAIVVGMLFVAGLSYKLLLLGIGTGVAAAVPAYLFLLDDYQKKRIQVFFNPGLDPMGDGYNVIQSMMSIGSGQKAGQLGSGELFNGNTLSQLNYLPAAETDFIFSVVSEALGFIGGITVIALYFILILKIIWISAKAKDQFGTLLAAGVASMLLFHVFENIGMTMGLMPITGLPLPFMSYGGSSMWANMIGIGLVLNVGMRRQKIKF